MTGPHPIVLYDGVCALCNRLVKFILKHDRLDRFRFAALQSDFARTLLHAYAIDPQALETVCLVLDHGQPTQRVETRSTAVLTILRELGPTWGALANLLSAIPRGLRDWAYKRIASCRYRIFGKYETCPLPSPGDRHKFLDLA